MPLKFYALEKSIYFLIPIWLILHYFGYKLAKEKNRCIKAKRLVICNIQTTSLLLAELEYVFFKGEEGNFLFNANIDCQISGWISFHCGEGHPVPPA